MKKLVALFSLAMVLIISNQSLCFSITEKHQNQWDNQQLMSELGKYIKYVWQLAKEHRVKNFVILIDHSHKTPVDEYIFSVLFYKDQIKKSCVSSYKVVNGIAVLWNDENNKSSLLQDKTISYISNRFLPDDAAVVLRTPSKQLRLDSNAKSNLRKKQDSIVIENAKIFDSDDMKNVDISPKRWFLKFKSNSLVSKTEDAFEKTPQ